MTNLKPLGAYSSMAELYREAKALERWRAEPVAWSSRSKTGLLRGIRYGKPTEEDLAIAESDGDIMEYFCRALAPDRTAEAQEFPAIPKEISSMKAYPDATAAATTEDVFDVVAAEIESNHLAAIAAELPTEQLVAERVGLMRGPHLG